MEIFGAKFALGSGLSFSGKSFDVDWGDSEELGTFSVAGFGRLSSISTSSLETKVLRAKVPSVPFNYKLLIDTLLINLFVANE